MIKEINVLTCYDTLEKEKREDMTTRMLESDPLLTPEDMAKIIPYSTETIRAHIKRGDLEGIHIGKRYFVRQSKFNEWLEKHTSHKQEEDNEL